MKVEIINVGTELLLGEIVNTNAPYIFKLCKELGFDVYYQSTVGDNPDRLLHTLEEAFNHGSDMVITTGGLGPTQDDLTKELSAKYLGLELVYNEEEARKVKDKCEFLTHLGQITDNNFKQAYYPVDAYILENPVGTANGCVMKKDNKMIVNLPGPPKELTYVVDHALKDYLMQYKQDRIYSFDLLEMGLGESKVDDMLTDLQENQKEVTLAMYAGEGYVRIRMAVKASSKEEAETLVAPMKKEIESRLEDYLIKEENIQEALKKIIVPLHFTGEMEVPAFFKQYVNNDYLVHIHTTISHRELGDHISFTINNDYSFTISTLSSYKYSENWITNRLVLELYKYIKNSFLS